MNIKEAKQEIQNAMTSYFNRKYRSDYQTDKILDGAEKGMEERNEQ